MTERRKLPRSFLSLPVEVSGYSCENGSFVEKTQTFNVSPLGVSFKLESPVVVDDILRLTMPMPANLRLFGLDLPEYQIYAQVRRTRPSPDGRSMIGVAFISKDPPELDAECAAYEPPPDQDRSSAAINSPDAADSSQRRPTINPKTPVLNGRHEPRANLRFNLSISGRDRQGRPFVDSIHTEDVSRRGLCFFFSSRDLEPNSIIQLIGFQGKFNAQAEIRHVTYCPKENLFRIGVRLLGEPQNWIVR